MIPLVPEQFLTLRSWFLPDRPGPQVGLHLIQTGWGSCLADRWPAPRALLVEVAGNYSLVGDPASLSVADLSGRIRGFLEAPSTFDHLILAAFPASIIWPRLIMTRVGAPLWQHPPGFEIRRLLPSDSGHLRALSSEVSWISRTWGGPDGLANGLHAWGAFVAGLLVSVACTFFVGESYEDIGVVTEPKLRGLGLSTACVAGLCTHIVARGRRPSWSTSPDNVASLRVAAKLGFTVSRHDRLFVINEPVPEPPSRL
jgi:GNAT superfamily N-acetyltransferase